MGLETTTSKEYLEKQLLALPEEFHNVVRTLPQELQDTILSPRLQEKIAVIVDNQPFDEKQRNDLKTEILLVLMQYEDASRFTTNVTHHVHIARERAEKISRSIMQEIFSPVMHLLSKEKLQPGHQAQGSSYVKQETPPKASGGDKVRSNSREESEFPQQQNAQFSATPQVTPQTDATFHNKLERPTYTPLTNENISDTPKEEGGREDTYHGRVDPYRESTN